MPRIKIEDKHTYSSQNLALHGRMSATAGGVFDPDQIQVNFPTFPAPGTDESNRIGRKITTSSLSWETFLSLSNLLESNTGTIKSIGQLYRVYANNLDELLNVDSLFFPGEFGNMLKILPLNISIREFVVEFDTEFFQDFVDGDVIDTTDANFKILMKSWFDNLVILNGTNGPTSNRTQIKRESTGYTGQFNILYDKIHYMSFSKPIIHIKQTIPYKRTLNFNSGTNAIIPSNKMVIHFFIGPNSVLIDYGNYSFGEEINSIVNGNNQNKAVICQIYETLKLKYVDI